MYDYPIKHEKKRPSTISKDCMAKGRWYRCVCHNGDSFTVGCDYLCVMYGPSLCLITDRFCAHRLTTMNATFISVDQGWCDG